MKKVSVIVPVYNVEKYLPKCLDSIVGQTYENLEIICVDDGSPDNSAEILRNYAEKDNRIKVISKENNGLSSARNAGMEIATGEYIVFVDSDDWIDENTIESAVSVAENEGFDMVMWGYTREYKYQSVEKHIFDGDRCFNRDETRFFVHRRMAGLLKEELSEPENGDSIVTAWGKLYNTKKIKDNNLQFVDTKIIGTEDVLFNIYYFGLVDNCKFINQPFNHYRKDNETSLTRSYKPQLSEQWATLYEMMFDFIKENPLCCSENFEEALYNRVCLSMIGLGLNEYCRKASFTERREKIDEILHSPMYREAYDRLDLSYFPPHWKMFFRYCKTGSATRICVAIGAIKLLMDRKNQTSR